MQLDNLRRLNLLYVEDDHYVLEPLVNSLNKIFNQIHVAQDGLSGLELYQELYDTNNHIDLIITDISMPNMNGIEMIQEIKKINPSIDFIITTAKSDAEFLIDAIELGANHYFLKPMNVQELLSKINKITTEKIENQIMNEHSKLLSMQELIGNIAHQWRQPLSAISTTASSVKINNDLDLFDKEEVLQQMEFIERKAQYLSEIINNFSNILDDDGEPKRITLQDIIDKVINIEKDILKDHNIKLYNEIDYTTPVKPIIVIGKLEQVIIDILNNSQEIMNEKYIKDKWIKIGLETTDYTATVTIEDNGGGIPDDILPKIFEPYFTTKHQSQGAGLGLNICYRVVTKSLNGKLYAQNSENGAKFFIQIPLDNKRVEERRQTNTIEVKEEKRKKDRRS